MNVAIYKYCAVPVLNGNVRVFNWYWESPELPSWYLVVHPQRQSELTRTDKLQVRLEKVESRKSACSKTQSLSRENSRPQGYLPAESRCPSLFLLHTPRTWGPCPVTWSMSVHCLRSQAARFRLPLAARGEVEPGTFPFLTGPALGRWVTSRTFKPLNRESLSSWIRVGRSLGSAVPPNAPDHQCWDSCHHAPLPDATCL